MHQQTELIGAEGVKLVFEDDAIREIARMAAHLNKTVENIGARRLHTVMERIMETISFDAAELDEGSVCFLLLMFLDLIDGISYNSLTLILHPSSQVVVVNKATVEERLKDVTMNADVSRYIL